MKQKIADAKIRMKGSDLIRHEPRVGNNVVTRDPAELVYKTRDKQSLVGKWGTIW